MARNLDRNRFFWIKRCECTCSYGDGAKSAIHEGICIVFDGHGMEILGRKSHEIVGFGSRKINPFRFYLLSGLSILCFRSERFCGEDTIVQDVYIECCGTIKARARCKYQSICSNFFERIVVFETTICSPLHTEYYILS